MTASRNRGPLIDGIGYGGDFNPEQWDVSYVDRDIELMQAAGVNLVTVGVFSWAVFEPSPGEYRFDWLEHTMDALHTAGISVDLATGTASPPPWLGRLYPETLPTTREGVRLSWGSRQQYSPSSAVYRNRVEGLVSRLAERFARHPALVAWHVNNEYGCHVSESFDDESAERFRTWLGNRYGSLEALNAAWGTSFWSQRFAVWDDVIPPRATPTLHNPHHLDDWRRFSSDMLLELYLLERAILRRANPAIPVTTNFMGLFRPVNYWDWAPHLDFISNDSYPDPANPAAAREFAFDCDLMRSLGGGRPFVQMEQVTSAVQWRPRNAVKRPGQYALWSLMAVGLGADAILNFQWRQSLAGAEAFHGAMVPHTGVESRTWAEVVALGGTLSTLEAVGGGLVSNDVAIVWDWENAWAYEHAVGPTAESAPENETRDWHATFFELGVGVDFVHPGSDLSAYSVVVVPALFRMTDAHSKRLTEAARAGASVVVTRLSGYVNEWGHATEGGYLKSLEGVLGVRVVDISPRGVDPFRWGRVEELRTEVDRISAAVRTPAADAVVRLISSDARGVAGAGRSWAETVVIDAEDVEVVARFAATDVEGDPAITVRETVGGGAGWYVATDLDSSSRADLMRTILESRGIRLEDAPAGLQVLRRGRLSFLLNHSDNQAQFQGHVVPPRGSVVLSESCDVHSPTDRTTELQTEPH